MAGEVELVLIAFNRGLVDRLGLARADIPRIALSCEVSENWVPRLLGSMSIRAGTGKLQNTLGNKKSFDIPFVFSATQKNIIEVTNQAVRVLDSNDQVISRPGVQTTITNPNFDADLSGWTVSNDAGGNAVWKAGGYLSLFSTDGVGFGLVRQTLSVAAGDLNREHSLKIVIARGPVVLRVGNPGTPGFGGVLGSPDDSLIKETTLDAGAHSLAFTPGGPFVIQFESNLQRIVLVDSCNIEPAGDMVLAAPWLELDMGLIRYDQSLDVMFVACNGYQQQKIERRGLRSWSVVVFQSGDGPFMLNNTGPITIATTTNVLDGNTQLVASKPLFRPSHVGALFRLQSSGQTVTGTFVAQNTFTAPIMVQGTGSRRNFYLQTGATGANLLTLQRSAASATGPWEDVVSTGFPFTFTNFAVDTAFTYADGLDNQTIWYRIGVKTGNYAAGSPTGTLIYSGGSITGVVRITDYVSNLIVNGEITKSLGNWIATTNWSEGLWSFVRGYPTAVSFYEGRLVWSGRDKLITSGSDSYYSYDEKQLGDAAPINRSLGGGQTDVINWLLPMQRLIAGGQLKEYSVRSSTLDEPLTPTNFNIKTASTQGSSNCAAVTLDQTGLFVQRGGFRVYELNFNQYSIVDYNAVHVSAMVPSIGKPGIIKMLVQRQPETRIHALRSDGTVAMLVYDKVENVAAWVNITSTGAGGFIEDGVVLPGADSSEEDQVYYTVRRTIGGVTKRFRERWALQADCLGQPRSRLADCAVYYVGVPANIISGLDHLEGQQVVVWADGIDVGTAADGSLLYTVSGGLINLAVAASDVTVGLPYSAPWKSGKMLSIQLPSGQSVLAAQLVVRKMALIMADIHNKGIKIGKTLDESKMESLPDVVAGNLTDPNLVFAAYDNRPVVFPGDWGPDERLCLLAKAPRPATVLAALGDMEFA